MQVIFHIDEPVKWPMVAGNVKNLLNYYADQQQQSVRVEVLVNGPAVEATAQGSQQAPTAVTEILAAGENVTLAVCQNALNGLAIKPERLVAGVTIVPAGVVELAEKQAAGYQYIKP